ncbi:M1 family peptidase [Altererythrobacter salegens]|uniref:Aminopeptidase n=1 Tax=Croceibacterium salegens TaxID=1737568 RepID=A0A6I4T298_9SPHN|nr:M1 family metallopeptidase [Croceibacterium salegens]MXO60782.1 M1 family peptidase [Croceibacterium salegens]
MRFITAVSAAALLAGCATVPSAQAAPTGPSLAPLPSSITSELPRNARPSHYAIEVVPDAENLTFTGTVVIDLAVFEPSKTITLNSVGLTVSGATIVPQAGGKAIALQVSYDEAKETAIFTAPEAIGAGDYRMTVAYSGPIGRKPSGFFALDYPDKKTGESKRALGTQFEIPDAREFAPMFDEPSYKATFDVSAVVPADQMALSNMPVTSETDLGDGTKRVVFATTPKMSSYLLFFGVGDFERLAQTVDGTSVGIVSPTGSGETARYALDEAVEVLPYYNDYFGVKYPLPKLDNIGMPGSSQQFGAMENWGAIFTFEDNLLVDPRTTSPDKLKYIHTALAHEMAHQWFGDLVTMAWWDDLWLNEGFASWMESKATAKFRPDWNTQVGKINSREAAMGADAMRTTHPIVLTSETASEADEQFDSIAYSKGETILTMFEDFVGEDTWRNGIRGYMKAHAYGNTTTDDLWRAVEQAGAKGLVDIAKGYTLQSGVPLVTASVTCANGRTSLTFKQGQFSRDQQAEVAAKPNHWLVPMTIIAADGSKHPLVLDGTTTIDLPGCGAVNVNGGQLSYFRTLYSHDMLMQLTAALPSMAPRDQLGLVRDNLALAAASYQDYDPALDMLLAVPGNANPMVVETSVSQWSSLYDVLNDEGRKATLAKLVHDTYSPRLAALGFDSRPGESLSDASLRAELIGDLGKMGDPAVVAEARRRFALLAKDRTALDGELKGTWLSIVARNATAEDWEFLRRYALASTDSVERKLLVPYIGAPKDDALAMKALELALSKDVQPDEGLRILTRVAANHADMAYEFALAHKAQIDPMLDDSSRSGFYPRLGASSDDPAMLEKVKALRDSYPANERVSVNRTIAGMENRFATYPRIREQLGAWLASR